MSYGHQLLEISIALLDASSIVHQLIHDHWGSEIMSDEQQFLGLSIALLGASSIVHQLIHWSNEITSYEQQQLLELSIQLLDASSIVHQLINDHWDNEIMSYEQQLVGLSIALLNASCIMHQLNHDHWSNDFYIPMTYQPPSPSYSPSMDVQVSSPSSLESDSTFWEDDDKALKATMPFRPRRAR